MATLALAPILILTALAPAPTLKDTFESKYKQFNSSIAKGDQSAAAAWIKNNCSSKFSYTSYQKHKYKLDEFASGVAQQIQTVSKVISSSMTIRTVEQHGDQAVVIVVSQFKGIVSIDSRRMTLTDASVSSDTWTKSGKDWKFLKSVQVNADTQMHEQGD